MEGGNLGTENEREPARKLIIVTSYSFLQGPAPTSIRKLSAW